MRSLDAGPISEMAGSSSCLNSAVTEPAADVRITHYNHVVPERFTTEVGLNATGVSIDWAIGRLGYGSYQEFGRDVETLSPLRPSTSPTSPTANATIPRHGQR